MEKIKQAKHITSMELAEKLGTDKEYKQALQEQELKANFDVIMGENIESIEENNFIINGNEI
jgi:hypothetical protein